MDSLSYSTLALEVTRRCNMCCAHCLRGDSQDKDMPEKIVDAAFDRVQHISELLLTGGEPSLNTPILRYIAKEIRARHIDVDGIFIATNGKIVTNDFLLALIDLYSACNAEEAWSCLALSQDAFHEEIPAENVAKLKAFRFFSEDAKKVDFTKTHLLNLGRARELNVENKIQPPDICGDIVSVYQSIVLRYISFEDVITITADGDVLCGCDYEYDAVARKKVGNVLDPCWTENILQRIAPENISA